MEIRVVVKRSLVYSLLFVFVFGISAFIILVSGKYIQNLFGINFILGTALLAFILAIVFQPLRKILQKGIDAVFYKDEKLFDDIQEKIVNTIQNNIELKEIINNYLSNISRALSIKNFQFFILNEESNMYKTVVVIGEVVDSNYSIEESDRFIKSMKKINNIVIKDEVPIIISDFSSENDIEYYKTINEELEKNKMGSALLIGDREKTLGVLFMGNRLNNAMFSIQDVKFIKETSFQAAKAINNALLYKYALERVKREYID